MINFLEFSDDDLEEMERAADVPKNVNFFEETVPLFTDAQFTKHFRVTRNLATELSNRYGESQYYNYHEGDSEKISPSKIIHSFLWFSCNEGATFRDVSDRFGITISSLHKLVTRVIYFLSNLSVEVITWPTNPEKIEIEQHFRDNGFPGIIGIIDGTHIRINKPQEDPDSYLNRKHFYSIQLQVVCDHTKKIRDVFVGYPGSVHDSRVFRASPLFNSLEEKCGNYFIIGDSGYPCLRHCLTPFRDRGNLSRRQRNYNYILSKNRYLIEHCFGLLKQKFRQLYHLKIRKIDLCTHFIRALCVLHNLTIEQGFAPEIEDQENEIQELQVDEQHDDINGNQRRNEVMNGLPFQI